MWVHKIKQKMCNTCSGITKKGVKCKRKVKNGDFCFSHISQDSLLENRDNKCCGITKKGTKCKRKVKNGDFCFSHIFIQREYDHNNCCICLDEIGYNKRTLACGHSLFHSKCINTWFKTNRSCPLCRNRHY